MKILLSTFCALAIVEYLFKGYSWPKQPLWILRGLTWLALVIFCGEITALWLYPILHPYALADLSTLGMWALIPTIVVYQILVYVFHRALHEIPFLWRIHQTHHCVERLDIWSAYHTPS